MTWYRWPLAALAAFVLPVTLAGEAGATNLSPVLPVTCLDSNGLGCRIEIYEDGTSTPYTVYTDQARTAGATTVITANSSGYFADYYCNPADTLKFIVTNNDDTANIHTQDDVDCPLGASEASDVKTALGLDGSAASASLGTSGDVLCKINANCTVSGTWEFTTAPSFSSTSAGATVAPTLEIYRNSASPAVDDDNGEILFTAEDDGSNKFNVCSIIGTTIDETDTTEDGQLQIVCTLAGSPTDVLEIGALNSAGSQVGLDLETGLYYRGGTVLVDEFEPSDQDFNDDAELTFAHGLSCTPKDVSVWLVATANDLSYVTGDRVLVNTSQTQTSDMKIVTYVDGTNVYVQMGVDFSLLDGSFNGGNITEANWDVSVYAKCNNFE